MERRECPVCGVDSSRLWLRKNELQIVNCSGCGMKYVPDPLAIASDYYETAADAFYTSADKIRGDYAPPRYDREIAALAKNCAGGRVLDVGCSTGGFLYQTKIRFGGRYDLLGIDIAPNAVAVAVEHGVKAISTSFLKPQVLGGDFNAITFWAVLEHLISPKDYVKQAHGLLTPGGLVFVVVPNVQSLAQRLLGKAYRYVLPEHVNYFSARTLTRLFDPEFVPVSITSSHFNPFVIAQDMFRRSNPTPRERAELLNKTNSMKRMTLLKPLLAFYRITERGLGSFGLADNILAVFLRSDS